VVLSMLPFASDEAPPAAPESFPLFTRSVLSEQPAEATAAASAKPARRLLMDLDGFRTINTSRLRAARLFRQPRARR
jgi:hypothetical protein